MALLGRPLPLSLLAALLLSGLARAAGAVDRRDFCDDLSSLASHVAAGSLALNATNNLLMSSVAVNCACGDPEGTDGSFAVDCAVEETYVEFGEAHVQEFFERMVFAWEEGEGAGEYALAETSWGRDYDSFGGDEKLLITREKFYFEDGALTACEANACKSCDVCDDGTSVAVDCSVGEVWGFSHECDGGYTGSFVNTFDFGIITGEDVVLTPVPDIDDDGDDSRDAFCRSLTDLEAHMDQSFEQLMGLTFLSGFACACGELDESKESFAVDCIMEGAEGHITFKSSEHMVFKLREGKYGLGETSWDWEDSGGPDDDVEESFVLEDGVVTSCEARDCASCGVCDDGTSIAVNCTDRDVGWYSYDCGDGYTGSFSHTFDFGVIVETATDDAEDGKETGPSAIDSVDYPGAAAETPAADATGTEASIASADDSTGDADAAQPDPAGVDVVSAPNDALASHKTSWRTAPAFFIAAGFLVI